MILKCKGIFIDSLRAISGIMEPSELTVTTLNNEMKKKIPFLIDHIWNKIVVEPTLPLASTREFIASLSLVLTGGYLNSSPSASGKLVFDISYLWDIESLRPYVATISALVGGVLFYLCGTD